MDLSLEDQLYEAIVKNDVNNVRKIVRQDVNINNVCSSGLTPLGAAAHLGNLLICEILLDSHNKKDECTEHKSKKICLDNEYSYKNENKNIGYYVVRKDEDDIGDGPTPEGMEALEWDVEIKEGSEALERGEESYSRLYRWYAEVLTRTSEVLRAAPPADVNQADRWGRTALQYACERGDARLARLLLAARGCTPDGGGGAALRAACAGGHVEVARALLEAGARAEGGALHAAARQGHWRVVQLLLAAGAPPDAPDSHDRTPLLVAVRGRWTRAADLLLRAGARPNAEDAVGATPLREAVWQGSAHLVRSLLAAGARVTQSHQLLHHAAMYDRPDVAAPLLAAGCVVNLRDAHGNTPLMLAARAHHVRVARVLLEHGAKADARNAVTGATAALLAVEHARHAHDAFARTLELLVAHGADLELQCNWETPLHRAVAGRDARAMACLVRAGADINHCNMEMNVDTMRVIINHDDLVAARLLVYAGYDLNRRPDVGFVASPLDSAVTRWLVSAKSNAMSLTNLCRIRIRKHLGKKVYFQIHHLGLPKQLVKFLNFEDID